MLSPGVYLDNVDENATYYLEWPTHVALQGEGWWTLTFADGTSVRYTAIRSLGSGGAGAVDLIEPERPGKPVLAAKLYLNDKDASAEAEFLHSGLVDDAMVPGVMYSTDRGPVLIMQVARPVSALRGQTAAMIADAVMKLQQKLLENGVYYSDAKPDNLGIVPSRRTGKPKLVFVDYGGICMIDSPECPFTFGYVPMIMWKRKRWGFANKQEAMTHLREVANTIGQHVASGYSIAAELA